MNAWLYRIQYRWHLRQDISPPYVVYSAMQGDDKEPIELFQRLRAVITGYGPGWTFSGALWDWVLPKVITLACIIVIIFIIW